MFVHLFGPKSLSARPFVNAIACYSGAIAGYLKQWSVVLVELRQTNGDTIEYKHLVEDEIRPAFKDEVWVWQDEPEHYIQGGEQQEE